MCQYRQGYQRLRQRLVWLCFSLAANFGLTVQILFLSYIVRCLELLQKEDSANEGFGVVMARAVWLGSEHFKHVICQYLSVKLCIGTIMLICRNFPSTTVDSFERPFQRHCIVWGGEDSIGLLSNASSSILRRFVVVVVCVLFVLFCFF